MKITYFGISAWLSLGLTFGKFAMPVSAPIERLVKNTDAYVKTNPEDPRGYYTLGRLHYLAFALRTDTARYYEGEPPSLETPFSPVKPVEQAIVKISEDAALRHLIASVDSIETALRLDPGSALYHLTAACIFEDGAVLASRVRRGDTTFQWAERAITEYRRAHELSWPEDSKHTREPLKGFTSLVSYESGLSYLRLTKARGIRPQERAIVAATETHMKKLTGLPRGPVTPVVLSLTGRAWLTDLLDASIDAPFDLDGTGRPQKWPWLRADTGVLVWDPGRTGLITSGRQLFGTVTWWMFWENGYDALAALDDDRNGWLTAGELDGISVWFDRNQNGRSDPGEVMTAAEAGIEAIHVRADGREGSSLKSSQGIRMRGGSFLPTWDWVVGTR